MISLRQISAAERIDGLLARGVELYVDPKGQLRYRCEPCFRYVLEAAVPAIRLHRAAIVAHLATQVATRAE